MPLDSREAPKDVRNVKIVDVMGTRIAVAVLTPEKMETARALGILDESRGYPVMLYDNALVHGFYKDPPALPVDWRKEADYIRTHKEPDIELM